jgi:HAD superfamily hydrolase (TIGR01549 family)
MIRTVLMDLDGTLIDTWRLYVEAYRHVLEEVGERPLTSAEVAVLRPAAELKFFDRVLGAGSGRKVQSRFLAYYDALHDQYCEGFYAGIPDLLAELRRGPYALGIVTGKSRGAWRITLERMALQGFHVVVTDDDVARPKPAPDGLLLALERLGAAASETVYVGDSLVDLEAARAAGMAAFATLWPKGPEEREAFLAAAATLGGRPVETPADLLRYLRNEGG